MWMQHSNRSRLVLLATFALLALHSLSFASEGQRILRGQIDPKSVDSSPAANSPLTFVTSEGKKYQVAGDSMSNAQLRDPLLIDRTWELEGTMQADGKFEIVKLFTIKDGKRFRVTYYCEICNIVTHEPGDCMCCQAVTELREIPGE
jgi:hypothetical protein